MKRICYNVHLCVRTSVMVTESKDVEYSLLYIIHIYTKELLKMILQSRQADEQNQYIAGEVKLLCIACSLYIIYLLSLPVRFAEYVEQSVEVNLICDERFYAHFWVYPCVLACRRAGRFYLIIPLFMRPASQHSWVFCCLRPPRPRHSSFFFYLPLYYCSSHHIHSTRLCLNGSILVFPCTALND